MISAEHSHLPLTAPAGACRSLSGRQSRHSNVEHLTSLYATMSVSPDSSSYPKRTAPSHEHCAPSCAQCSKGARVGSALALAARNRHSAAAQRAR